jgi:hypothetical protein
MITETFWGQAKPPVGIVQARGWHIWNERKPVGAPKLVYTTQFLWDLR